MFEKRGFTAHESIVTHASTLPSDARVHPGGVLGVWTVRGRGRDGSPDSDRRFEALTSDDIEQLRANETTLQALSSQVDGLDPPQGYEEQYRVFDSAIAESSQAVQVAYDVIADPTIATKIEFDDYDRHAQEAAERLQRSNEILGRDYRTIEGVREIS